MKDFLKKFLLFFIIIDSAVFFVVWISAMKEASIPTDTIIKVFLVSAATALVTAIVFSIEPKKKIGPIVNILIFLAHLLSLCLIVFFGGTRFGWFEATLKGFLNVAISVGIVYVITAAVYIILVNKETKALNEALKDYSNKEAE